MTRAAVARAIVALAATAVAVLAVEGALSLFSDRSLTELGVGGAPVRAVDAAAREAEDRAIARGPFTFSSDPLVAFHLRRGMDEIQWGARVRTDELGLRQRPGPPPEEGAPRIVVLGDSVAFGLGVSAADAVGNQLEQILAANTPEGAPRPFVRTVACPAWNIDNSSRFLLNHLDEFAPDIVLFIPVQNDLDTTSAVTDRGYLYADPAPRPDGSVPPIVSHSSAVLLERSLLKRFEGAWDANGNYSSLQLHSGVTPESARRFRHMASRLHELRERLASIDARLVLAPLDAGIFERRLVQFLAEGGEDIPVLDAFRRVPSKHRQADNAHPTPRLHRAMALRMARALYERGWLAGEADTLPVDDLIVDNVYRFPSGDALAAQRREMDERALPLFADRVDFRTGEGCNQVYGGVRPDGTVGTSFFAVLRNSGAPRLQLELRRLEGVRGLYPLDLHVLVNGTEAGTLAVEEPSSDGPNAELSLDVPSSVADAAFLEVYVSSSHWANDRFQGFDRQRSFEFRLLALVE